MSAPSAPTGVAAIPATGQAQVSWVPPSDNGGTQVTGYTVTPYIGSAAQTAVQVAGGSTTSTTVTGLTTNTAYTFTVAAKNAVGTGQPSAASASVSPEDTLFDFSSPATTDSGDTSPIELGDEVHRRLERNDHRYPLLQGGRQHGRAHRQPVVDRRPAARHGDVLQRDRLRVADPDVREPGGDHGRNDLRRELLRAERSLLGHVGGVQQLALRQPTASRARDDNESERRLQLQLVQHVPGVHLQRHQLLGGRPVRPVQLR